MCAVFSRPTALLFRRWPTHPHATSRRDTPRIRLRARLAVIMLPGAFILALSSLWTVVEVAVPEITCPEYHIRLRIARRAQAEQPDRPLALVMGSSRLVWAFQPEEVPDPGTGLHWVNFAQVGTGPTLSRVMLHRLLRDGVRPAVLVLEVMPLFFVNENSRFVCGQFTTADMPLARRYSDKALSYEYHFLWHRLRRAPDIARAGNPLAATTPLLPRGGHPHQTEDVTPAERARRTAAAHKANAAFLARMTVRPGADRAFRDTLTEAAAHGIQVVLLRSPEGPIFRSWYHPEKLAHFDRYIAEIAAAHGAPILDARDWLEEDDFYDSHHVLRRGAAKFTARFATEVAALLPPAR